MSGVGTPDTVWVDIGDGYVETGLFDPDVDTAIGVRAASPLFWEGGAFALPGVEGEPDTIFGIPAQRIELSEALGAFEALGFVDFEDVEFEDGSSGSQTMADGSPAWT